MKSDPIRFETELYRPEGVGTSTFARCPFPIAERLGSRGQVPVAGTLNGIPFRGMLLPWGDGTHCLTVDRSLREAAGISAGDHVAVECAIDREPRPIEVPSELAATLEGDADARAAFESLAPSHRKEYARWIAEAAKPETRIARAVKAAAMLREGKKLK